MQVVLVLYAPHDLVPVAHAPLLSLSSQLQKHVPAHQLGDGHAVSNKDNTQCAAHRPQVPHTAQMAHILQMPHTAQMAHVDQMAHVAQMTHMAQNLGMQPMLIICCHSCWQQIAS